VIEPGPRVTKRVAETVRQARAERHAAKQGIAAAEALLMEALGLDRLDLSPQKCYTHRFRDLQAEARFDAEYFNPKYQRMMKKLRFGGRRLADVARLAERPFDPALRPKGGTFQYIEIGSLTGDGGAESATLDTAEAPSRAAWIVRPGRCHHFDGASSPSALRIGSRRSGRLRVLVGVCCAHPKGG